MTHTPAEIAAGRAARAAQATPQWDGWEDMDAESQARWIKFAMAIVRAHAALAPPTWPAPRPIAEATPELGQIMAWNSRDEMWDWFGIDADFKETWCDGFGDEIDERYTHFLPMPPAPKVTP